ncbi:MAG: hypothetical protein FWD84_06280 [Oscillospiraceae bacterium]|nr:hypothetical protein [Oscillospiraceae bacterium]
MHPVTVLLACFIVGSALLLLWRQGLLHSVRSWLVSIALLTGAMLLRLLVFNAETTDYQWFLAPWVEHFRNHGGFAGFHIPIGNYNVPYLYFLALFSYIPLPALHLIKLLSSFFDVLLAFYVMKTVGLYTHGNTKKMAAFFLTLFLPTIWLNSAWWGQCDSIYVTFVVMSFYYMMKEAPVRSIIALALAFAFKLQAIFIFPLYLIFLVAGKMKIWHLAVFPATYLAAILPAVLMGRPFIDTLLFYVRTQVTDGRGLNYNSPSIFAFNTGPHVNPGAATIGVFVAFAFVLLVYFLAFRKHKRATLSGEDYLTLALVFVIGVPLLLPHMHERYFYLADVFAVILGLSRLRYLPAIPLTQFASFSGYYVYLHFFSEPALTLPFHPFVTTMYYGTAALIAALAILLVSVLFRRSQQT